MTFEIILVMMFSHFVGDFIVQTDDMAIGKSTSLKWLTYHVATYMVPFMLVFPVANAPLGTFLWFIVANFVLHWIVDFATSRVSSWFYRNEMRGAFFKTIGFDQFIHQVSLFGTFYYFFL